MAAVLATPPPILPPSHKVSTIARVASLAARASAPANLPGPTLHITFKTVSFEQAGRYFLTLTAPDGTEHRTEVAEESRQPHFKAMIYSLRLSRADSRASLTIGATRLAFSRGATEVGTAQIACSSLVANHHDGAGNSGVRQYAVELVSPSSSMTSSSGRVGTLVLEYAYEDAAEEARRLAERLAAEAAERAAAELAAGQARAAAAAQAAHAAAERAVEEKVVAEQLAAEAARLKRLEAEERREAEMVRRTCEAEQRRLAAMAQAAVAATAQQQRQIDSMLTNEACRAATLRRWQRILASPVHLLRDDGLCIELTGRQVVGLAGKAAQSTSGWVAFEQAGRRVTLSATALAKMRARVEARLDEEEDEDEDEAEDDAAEDGAGVLGIAASRNRPFKLRHALVLRLPTYLPGQHMPNTPSLRWHTHNTTPSVAGLPGAERHAERHAERAATSLGVVRRPGEACGEAAQAQLPTGAGAPTAPPLPPPPPLTLLVRPQHATAPTGGRMAGVPMRAWNWLGAASGAASPRSKVAPITTPDGDGFDLEAPITTPGGDGFDLEAQEVWSGLASERRGSSSSSSGASGSPLSRRRLDLREAVDDY